MFKMFLIIIDMLYTKYVIIEIYIFRNIQLNNCLHSSIQSATQARSQDRSSLAQQKKWVEDNISLLTSNSPKAPLAYGNSLIHHSGLSYWPAHRVIVEQKYLQVHFNIFLSIIQYIIIIKKERKNLSMHIMGISFNSVCFFLF